MKSLFVGLFISSLSLTSCLGGSDYYRDRIGPFLKELKPHYKPQKVDGVIEPEKFPDLLEDQKTLIGIDLNHDGVRDDMEIFINRNFDNQVERENLKNEIKRTANFYMNYKKMTLDEFIMYESNDSADMNCIDYGIKYLGLKYSSEYVNYRSVEAIYNTKERSSTYSYFSTQLAGRAYGDGYEDKKIFESCKNKIDEKIKQKVKGEK